MKSQTADAFSFIAYVGDGGNDFCPALRLSPADFVFVREGFSLQKKIPQMKAGISIGISLRNFNSKIRIRSFRKMLPILVLPEPLPCPIATMVTW